MLNGIRISSRLKLLLVIVLASLITVGLTGLYSSYRANRALETTYEDKLIPLMQLNSVVNAHLKVQISIADAAGRPENMASHIRDILDNQAIIDKQWGDFIAKTQADEEDRRLVAKFVEARKHYLEEGVEPILAAMRANNTAEISRIRFERIVPLETPYTEAINALVEMEKRDVEQLHHDSVLQSKTMYVTAGAVILFSLTLCGVLGLSIIRGISASVGELRGLMARLSDGDFTARIEVRRTDEIGEISYLVALVNDQLGHLIGNVKAAAHRLAHTAQSVAMISSMTSEGVKTQKDETTQASAAVSHMASSLNESVNGSKNAVSVAETIAAQANTAKDVMSHAMTTIHTLAGEVRAAAEVIQALQKESDDIYTVTQLITDIANQTNLLALNAAIEAARAGEQGRGFAVVADEVRKLAQRTQDATLHIQNKIEALHNGVQGATHVMASGSDKAAESVVQINQTNERFEEIISSISAIRAVNAEIAASVEAQSQIATKINETIVNISTVSEQTAYSAKGTAVEIENIAVAAIELDRLVQAFTVPAAAGASGLDDGASPVQGLADDVLF